jgi:hypothetical protein
LRRIARTRNGGTGATCGGKAAQCYARAAQAGRQERSMSNGFWPFAWPNFAPASLNQPILPDWSLQHITVNYQGDPAIEKDVAANVASYGRQLGIITEAVLALADGGSGDAEPIKRLRGIAKKVEKIKEDHRSDLAASAQQAMDSLAKKDRAAAQRIAAEFARRTRSDSAT